MRVLFRSEKVDLGEGNQVVVYQAFGYNSNLHTLTMTAGSGLKNLGERSFYNCDNLLDVQLTGIDSIGTYAFANCDKLNKINIDARFINTYAFSSNQAITEVTFGDRLDSIANYAFANSLLIEKLAFPASLSGIGSYAFTGTSYYSTNSAIREIDFGTGLKHIGERAFQNSPLLTILVLPESIQSIGKNAFSGITNVRSITVGKSLTKAEASAFSGTSELLAIHWNSDTKMEDDLFSPDTNCLFYVTDKTEVPQKWTNIIRNGVAENISITN